MKKNLLHGLFILITSLILILDVKCDPNEDLIHAAKQGNFKGVERAIEKGANVDFQGKYGWTALNISVFRANQEMAKFLLIHGADPNIPNNAGDTPLMWANSVELVKLLLDYNADPNIQNKFGNTKLIQAASFSRDKIVKLLLDYDADPKIKNKKSKTALDVAKNDEIRKAIKAKLQHLSD